MSKTIRVGIFGAGNFANNQHLPNLQKIDGVEVVAVCDVNGEAARDTAHRFDIPAVYTDGHEMIEREPMDAMWSIIPAFARTDVEVTAVAKGIHLFSEKPQALRMSVARRIDEAIGDAGVLSSVSFRERYRPIFQEAKRLLADREVSHIRFQSIRPLPLARDTSTWRGIIEKGMRTRAIIKQSPTVIQTDELAISLAAAFFDWGPHAVDCCRFVSGLDVSTAQGYLKYDANRHGGPTSASFNYRMSNGATMTIVFACTTPSVPPGEPWFTFFYEGGYLAMHDFDYIEINGESVFEGHECNPWLEHDRRFCDAVRSGEGSGLLNHYHDGLYSLGPILAAWESSRRGGHPIDVEEYIASAD